MVDSKDYNQSDSFTGTITASIDDSIAEIDHLKSEKRTQTPSCLYRTQ